MLKNCFFAFLFLLVLLTSSCDKSKVIASVNINKVCPIDEYKWDSVNMKLNKGDVVFLWTDMDISYQEPIGLYYGVVISSNMQMDNDTVSFLPLEPNITFKEVKTNFNGETNWSYFGRFASVNIKETADYKFKVTLYSKDIERIKIKKANLVFKK